MATVTSLAAVSVAAFFGGWEWVVPCLVVLAMLWSGRSAADLVLATVGAGFFWLALFHWTGDRRLYFPYTMQFAVQMLYPIQEGVSKPSMLGGGGVIAVFILIRISQAAGVGVLMVELFVAIAVLALIPLLRGQTAREPKARAIAGLLGSTLACVGLLL